MVPTILRSDKNKMAINIVNFDQRMHANACSKTIKKRFKIIKNKLFSSIVKILNLYFQTCERIRWSKYTTDQTFENRTISKPPYFQPFEIHMCQEFAFLQWRSKFQPNWVFKSVKSVNLGPSPINSLNILFFSFHITKCELASYVTTQILDTEVASKGRLCILTRNVINF